MGSLAAFCAAASLRALLAACAVRLATAHQSPYFPSDVTICSAKDEHINQCFLSSTKKMLSHLFLGVRKINAVPMDPLFVPHIRMEKGNPYLPGLAFNLTDTVHTGWRSAFVTNARASPLEKSLNISFFIHQYNVSGLYEATGHLVGIPLEGSGDFDLYFKDVTYEIQLPGRTERRGLQDFFVVDKILQKSHIGDLRIDLRNLFGNEFLSNATNNLINKSMWYLLPPITPAAISLFDEVNLQLLQRIFESVPYNELFAELPT